MLARLEQVDGVTRAEVDRAGDLLRLTLHADVVDRVLTVLNELGYAADVEAGNVATASWYGRSSVGELSFTEAAVIAARVIPAFASEHAISATEAAALHDAVVATLHRCFTELVSGDGATGAFRQACARSVAAAARRYVDGAAAVALGAMLDADMSQDHR